MNGVRDFSSRRTIIALVLGQVLSLLITATGFSSSELAWRGINVPTSQSFLNYVPLAIVFGSIVIHRGKGLRVMHISILQSILNFLEFL
ncbi:hypothetical protein SUGI_0102270 [Cryptomeria japonica]|nr:hypothetical protein SUGI_0102270 [Cryptomeria japonica]